MDIFYKTKKKLPVQKDVVFQISPSPEIFKLSSYPRGE